MKKMKMEINNLKGKLSLHYKHGDILFLCVYTSCTYTQQRSVLRVGGKKTLLSYWSTLLYCKYKSFSKQRNIPLFIAKQFCAHMFRKSTATGAFKNNYQYEGFSLAVFFLFIYHKICKKKTKQKTIFDDSDLTWRQCSSTFEVFDCDEAEGHILFYNGAQAVSSNSFQKVSEMSPPSVLNALNLTCAIARPSVRRSSSAP